MADAAVSLTSAEVPTDNKENNEVNREGRALVSSPEQETRTTKRGGRSAGVVAQSVRGCRREDGSTRRSGSAGGEPERRIGAERLPRSSPERLEAWDEDWMGGRRRCRRRTIRQGGDRSAASARARREAASAPADDPAAEVAVQAMRDEHDLDELSSPPPPRVRRGLHSRGAGAATAADGSRSARACRPEAVRRGSRPARQQAAAAGDAAAASARSARARARGRQARHASRGGGSSTQSRR